MKELELTPAIKEWLEKEPEKRDLQEGADILLRITRNRILYANVTRNLKANAEVIEYNLKKIYNQRLQVTTHEEVAAMMKQVDKIAKARGLEYSGNSKKTDLQRGKRADHDELPAEVQKLFTDNMEIIRKMRDCHVHLRLISPENSTCPDNDRFPFAKEIIALDTLYRENFNKYDHYVKGTKLEETVLAVDKRSETRNAARVINLYLSKYAKEPSEDLKAKILETYDKILTPTASVAKKMADLGLLSEK